MENSQIHYSTENPQMLDFEYYSKLRGVAEVCRAIGIWTALFSVISLFTDQMFMAYYIANAIIFLGWGFYAYYSVAFYKQNAMFVCQSMMVLTLLSWIITILSGDFVWSLMNFIFLVGTVFGCGYGFIAQYFLMRQKNYIPRNIERLCGMI